MAEVQEQGT